MDSRCFIFDLVILNVWVNDFDYENNALSIEVNFRNTEFSIESNPEKLGEFKQGRTCEFEAYSEDLVVDLLNHPLKLKVVANGEEVKGEAVIEWPREMMNRLERPNFVTFSHFEECDLLVGRISTGKLSIQYRLRAKCELSENDEDNVDKPPCDIQNELSRIVDPNELFFLLQSDSDICNKSGTDGKVNKSIPATALDLSKFKSFHGKVVKNPELFDQVYALDCCHTKKHPTSGLKKSQLNARNNGPSPQKLLPKCFDSVSSGGWACNATRHVHECPHSDKFSDETTESGSSESLSDSEQHNAYVSNNLAHQGHRKYPQSPPVLKETIYVRPKLCPICKADISWLPKMATCPKCGHKPTPYAVERTYNENLTADQIIAHWNVDNSNANTISDKSGAKKINRCACKNGKICAYCRIRNLCKDLLKTKKCCGSNVKCSADSGKSLKGKSADKICKSTSEDESRTHLARVFSELQDLYNLKPSVQKLELNVNSNCETAFRKTNTSKVKKNYGLHLNKKSCEKNHHAEPKTKLCKRKLYNYKMVRKYPGTLMTHKKCVSSDGKPVPRHMGWLWNADTARIRSGWKPGAIRKPIKEIMKFFLKDFPVDSLGVSRYSRKQVVKNESEELVQKPTLHICKKNGAYYITMRPLKNASLLKHCADPYVSMKPIQFKIVKNPLMEYTSELKKQLKYQFNKCTCHKPVSQCFCRTYLEKKRLEFELNKACRRKGIKSLQNSLVLSDTSDSETEFDFVVTPPAGVMKPKLKKKPDLACRETQYSENDWMLKPLFPKPLNKLVKPSSGKVIVPGVRGVPTVMAPEIVGKKVKGHKAVTSGIVGGWGGIGGNHGGGWRTAIGTAIPKPLFCNLARRAKATPCYSYPAPCMPCVPIC